MNASLIIPIVAFVTHLFTAEPEGPNTEPADPLSNPATIEAPDAGTIGDITNEPVIDPCFVRPNSCRK